MSASSWLEAMPIGATDRKEWSLARRVAFRFTLVSTALRPPSFGPGDVAAPLWNTTLFAGPQRAAARKTGLRTAVVLAFLASVLDDGWRNAKVRRSAPKSDLYGIRNVDELTIDGVSYPPFVTDEQRWRRLIFDSKPGFTKGSRFAQRCAASTCRSSCSRLADSIGSTKCHSTGE